MSLTELLHVPIMPRTAASMGNHDRGTENSEFEKNRWAYT